MYPYHTRFQPEDDNVMHFSGCFGMDELLSLSKG
jgi:hypothetical protein